MKRFTSIITAFATLCVTASLALADSGLEVSSSKPGAIEWSNNTVWVCGTPEQTRVNFSTNTAPEIKPVEKFVPIEILVNGPLTIDAYKPGDINRDGVVDMDDLLMVINAWGSYAKGKAHTADIAPAGGNLSVDFDDMVIVLMNWGA